MEFINDNQSVSALPSIEDIEFIPLENNYLRVSLISNLLLFCFPLIALSVVYFIDDSSTPALVFIAILVLIGLLFLFTTGIILLGFKHKMYGLRDHDVIYKSGLIWRNETVVPFNRIQHVELGQGPLERIFDLSKLKIFTAGGSQSDLVIPGLLTPEAQQIKSFLIDKSKKHV